MELEKLLCFTSRKRWFNYSLLFSFSLWKLSPPGQPLASTHTHTHTHTHRAAHSWLRLIQKGNIGKTKASSAAVHGGAKSRTRLSDFTFPFHFHALEKEMATHSSVLAWRIPGKAGPGGLRSMGSHRVGHDWSDLAAAAAAAAAATFH